MWTVHKSAYIFEDDGIRNIFRVLQKEFEAAKSRFGDKGDVKEGGFSSVMNIATTQTWSWIWPQVGATPISQGLDSEMFDRTDYPYSETFVREAIQNSLDARLDPTRPVVMKFTFHSDGIGPRRAFLEQIMGNRKKAGLEVPHEWANGHVKWLVVEDFNSKGLGGSLTSRTSDFWNYWLNFGISNKDGSGRGGRGIGRVTFLIASRLQSVIGYTRRSTDGTSAICGMSVLRAMEDGEDFLSTHAYLAGGISRNIYTLHDSPEFHGRTRSAFAFTGYDGEFTSGLGLAIPYPHEELVPDGILAAAIENFAPAIMNGTLQLNVAGRVLDASSIEETAPDVSGRLNDEAIQNDVGRYLNLIQSGLGGTKPYKTVLPKAQKADLEARRNTAPVEALRKKLASGKNVVLEIEFPLEREGKEENAGIRAVLAATPPGHKPIDRLFREGMSLPDVRSRNPGELDMILLVDDGLLATYLNLCEGKAHLDLLESKDVRQKLEDKGFGRGLPYAKRLVKNLPKELRSFLTPDVTAPDAHVFDRFFSKPTDKPGKANPALTDWPVNVTNSLCT